MKLKRRCRESWCHALLAVDSCFLVTINNLTRHVIVILKHAPRHDCAADEIAMKRICVKILPTDFRMVSFPESLDPWIVPGPLCSGIVEKEKAGYESCIISTKQLDHVQIARSEFEV